MWGRVALCTWAALVALAPAQAGDPEPAEDTSSAAPEAADADPAEEVTTSQQESDPQLVQSRTVNGNMIEDSYALPSATALIEVAQEPEAAPAAPEVETNEGPAEPQEDAEPAIVLDPNLSSLRVKSRKLGAYPPQLEVVYGRQIIRCTSRVWVDFRGQPIRVATYACPAGFHLATATALSKWRWERSDKEAVPPDGLQVEATVGFERSKKRFFPGIAWLVNPREVTADPAMPALMRSGAMPKYPEQVRHGNAVCTVELTVTRTGATKDLLVDGCAKPYRSEAIKAVKKWKWYPEVRGGEPVESTVITDIEFKLANVATLIEQ